MIIEFIGLPGAGKTSLQTALHQHLSASNIVVRDRYALQQAYLKALSPLPRSGFFRRLGTLVYKGQLSVRLYNDHSLGHQHSDLFNRHLWRCGQRCLESGALLHASQDKHLDELHDLDEGAGQHRCSLRVWQRWSGKAEGQLASHDWISTQIEGQEVCFIVLDLDLNTALERLQARGTPAYWPNAPVEKVLDLYQQELDLLHDWLQSKVTAKQRIIRIDASGSLDSWQIKAAELASLCGFADQHIG